MLKFPVVESVVDLGLAPMVLTTEYTGYESSHMPILTAKFVAVENHGVVFEINSFDTWPTTSDNITDSQFIAASFRFFEGPMLSFIVDSKGRTISYKDGELTGETVSDIRGGEDEMGIYWGVRYTFSNDELEKVYGQNKFEPGTTVKGNIYKGQLKGIGKHFGGIAPVKEINVFSEENLADVEVILL